MRVYDVSIPLRPAMATYGDTEPGPKLRYHSLIKEGQSANVSELSLGSHTGTHVDAPQHFLDNGIGVDQMPVDYLVGPAHVTEFTGAEHITVADLEAAGIPGSARRLLVKTTNGRFIDDDAFHPEFVAFDDSAADWLAERFVLVGIDYLSIERYHSSTHAVHNALLAKGAVILEGLDLREVPPGEYLLVCAPLNVVGADGAPARVFLLEGVSGV
jgi:arylformamidase